MPALDEHGHSNGPSGAVTLLGACLCAVLIWYALAPVTFVFGMLKYPIDYFPGEGDFLVFTHRLLRGENIYSDSTSLPLLGNVWPPLYPWIMSLAARVGGAELSTMRILALAPALGVTVLVYLFSIRSGVRRGLALMAALAVLGMSTLSIHLINPRCDSWATFFSFAALYFFATPALTRRRVAVGACCAALALFGKQTAIFGMVALYLHLFRVNWRLGFFSAMVSILACVALAGVALAQFGAAFFHSIFLLSLHREFDASRFVTQIVPVLSALPILFGASLIRSCDNFLRQRWDWLDTYLLGQTVVVFLMLFDGSGENYFLPLLPGVCLAAALGAETLLQTDGGRLRTAAALTCGAALQLALQYSAQKALSVPSPAEWKEAQTAADFLTTTAEPVYTERFWGAIAGTSSSDLYFVEPVHVRVLASRRPAMQAIENAFRERRFARVLLLQAGFHWPEFGEMVLQYYRPVRLGGLHVSYGNVQILYLVPRQENESTRNGSGGP